MNIDERLDHYIVRCEALDAEGIGALLKEIKKERATLRQNPERGVTEAMVERAFQAMDAVFAAKWPDREPLDDAGKALACEGLRAALEAALSAPGPAAQGEDDFKNFHRLLCERFGYAHDPVDWKRDQLSLIEHIARADAPAQPAERVPEGWVLVPKRPTRAMLDCICAQADSYPQAEADYAAMLATSAAPAEEGDGKEVANGETHPTNRTLFKFMCAHVGIELGKDTIASATQKFIDKLGVANGADA